MWHLHLIKLAAMLLAACLAIPASGVAQARANDTGQQFPQATLSNGKITATVYLPDEREGYYRGTRFDRSGVIPSLQYAGHQYYGEWFDTHNPLSHDGIVGPVEEFSPLGYEQAKAGEEFVKIGVGSLIKPDDRAYVFHRQYTLSDPGVWHIENDGQHIAFTHVLEHDRYPYRYQKVIRLPEGEPTMILEHTLKNTGDNVLETRVYNHNFFVIDHEPTGPGYRVVLPGDTPSAQGAKGLADIVTLEGNAIRFLREPRAGEQVYFADLGAGQAIKYDIDVLNIRSGAGARIVGDRPISKMVFWASPTTVCPEPYIDVRVAPGETFNWTITYHFYRQEDVTD